MSKETPSPPPAPDYNALAVTQGAQNVETARTQARLNNPNISGPNGGQTVTWGDGDTPTINQYLSPSQQGLLDAQGRISQNLAGVAETGLNRVSSSMATPFDTSKVRGPGQVPTAPTQWGQIPTADSESAKRVTDALYQRASVPMERQNELTTNAALIGGHNRGGTAMNAIADDQSRARNDLALAADAAGGAEQSRLFNLQAQAGQMQDSQNVSKYNVGSGLFGLGQQAQQSDIQNQAYMRSLPLNELNALRSGSQVTTPTFQQYTGGGTIAPPPTMQGATLGYQAALGPYNAQLASNNAMTQGLFGLGGAGLGAYGNYAGLAALGA